MKKIELQRSMGVVTALILGLVFLISAPASAAVTSVTPNTWNIIGLDSNTPAFGPNRFPVGANVCSNSAGTVNVAFSWDTGGTTNDDTYIYLRPGSLGTIDNPLDLIFTAAGCKDAYFEVEVNPISASFDKTRRYHITAGSVSTPTPRELYVEHLVSQSRNAIDSFKVNGTSIPAGGTISLMVGNTYTIELGGHTAPGGYNQIEQFINFPNTIFQVLSVNTTYSSEDSPYVNGAGHPQPYADACGWENNPSLPTYMSCVGGDYKAGDTVINTYTVKILSGGSTQTLNTLIYDFSGSSFHYNSDFSTGARFISIVDPANADISKSFSPNPTNVNGVSALTFTLTNPNAGAISGYNFTDPLPANMKVADPPGATTTGCGNPTFTPAANDTTISFSNGTIAGNGNCVVKVNVTTTSTGTYTNTTNHLFVDTLDTGKSATANLTVNSDPPPGTGICGNTLASWDFPTGFTITAPAATVANVTASASNGAGVNPVDSTATQSGTTHSWSSNGAIATGATLSTANNDYFQFSVDTTNYSTIYLSFWAQRKINNSPKGIAVYYGTSAGNPETGTSIYNNSTVLATNTTWYQFGASGSLAIPVTSATTYVRIYAYNAGNSNAGSDVYIDDVVITGCGNPVKPTISKSFFPNPVAVNGNSTLTFTLTNTNGTQLTGAKFTDTLPSGLEVASPANASTTCTGSPSWAPTAGATTLSFGQTTGGNIPASGSCTVSVDIKATTAGPHNNVSGFLSTTEGGTNTNSVASASLTAILPPVISKLFSQNPILAGGTSTLTFTITNPNQNDQLTGVAFTDTFPTSPGNMVVATPATYSTSGCGTPTFSPAANDGSISFSNGTIAGGGTCTVNVNITAPVQSQMATVQSIASDTQLTLDSSYAGSTASGLTVSKNSTVAINGSVAVTNGSTTVTGTGTNFLTALSPGSIIYIGTYRNTSGAVSATTAGNGNTATDTLTVSPAHPAISVLKQLRPEGDTNWYMYKPVAQGTNVYYRFIVENVGDVDLTSVRVEDDMESDGTGIVTVCSPGSLAKYATTTCSTGPVSAVTGFHPNTATAYGTYNGTEYPSSESVAMYATTGVTLVKNATQAYFTAAGNTLNYSYIVTNNNAAPLQGPITVTDDKATTVTCPAVTTVGNGDNYLDSYSTTGEKVTCTATYTVTASDVTAKSVTNTATATIDSVTSNTATKTVPLAPDLSVTKANNVSGTIALNGTFKWTLTVSNTASAGTASFSNGQTLLTDDLPTSGATYSVPATATNAGGTTGTIACAASSNTLTCTASGGAVTIPSGGSFSIEITVTATAFGSLVNPKSGGICKADPSTVESEIDETNNNCAQNTVTVTSSVNLTVTKTVQAYSDPINGIDTAFGGSGSAKAIPGSEMLYTILVTNSGAGSVDNNTTVITDAIDSSKMALCVSITCSNPPITFSCSGTPPCGLTYTYATDVTYSNQGGGGAPYNYTPAPDGAGYDGNITGLRINPGGTLAGSASEPYPNFTIKLKVRVK